MSRYVALCLQTLAQFTNTFTFPSNVKSQAKPSSISVSFTTEILKKMQQSKSVTVVSYLNIAQLL